MVLYQNQLKETSYFTWILNSTFKICGNPPRGFLGEPCKKFLHLSAPSPSWLLFQILWRLQEQVYPPGCCSRACPLRTLGFCEESSSKEINLTCASSQLFSFSGAGKFALKKKKNAEVSRKHFRWPTPKEERCVNSLGNCWPFTWRVSPALSCQLCISGCARGCPTSRRNARSQSVQRNMEKRPNFHLKTLLRMRLSCLAWIPVQHPVPAHSHKTPPGLQGEMGCVTAVKIRTNSSHLLTIFFFFFSYNFFFFFFLSMD